ncbi:hypothetical protein IHE45_17G050900 [Dioscorea alata]|uniref:Uncharacterized protein n=1 Tax=Dioscorea alata TaxID=55571 RepID=A0ACB7UC51_DIOAL|nr:hypothetical protein IHE45_17G050900 [Dioscorea alata]
MKSMSKSILELQVKVGKWYASNVHHGETSKNQGQMITVKHTIEKILQKGNTAAGIVCQLKNFQQQSSKLPWTKDLVGVVATLGIVKDDNLNRLLSEYLGPETMLAVVCKTLQGMKALEMYVKEGRINENASLHSLEPSIGKLLDGRFLAISLENLRAYCGKFWANDPQKRLDLLKPKLPNGKYPPGFLGFAVNMIDLDHDHLSYLTIKGHGLRETLFYSLFSRLQIYKSKVEMDLAMPYIDEGAISMDGGMIKANGLFYLRSKFPTTFGRPTTPMEILEIQDQLKLLQWKKERLHEDILREETLLKKVKGMYLTKQEEYEKILNDTYQDISKVLPK